MHLTIHDDPDAAEWKAVDDGLGAYNDRFAPPSDFQRLAIFLRDEDGKLMGGLLGETYWGWLYVETLWVAEGARGQGWGTKLLAAGEAEALKRGCRAVHLDTMSFQALPFYQKHGYTVWGTLENFIGDHNRYFLRKQLNA
jgi:ribosomal protein S18 acetylase RimI-like enzyme